MFATFNLVTPPYTLPGVLNKQYAMPLTQKNSASTLLTTVLITILTATMLLALEYINVTTRPGCYNTQLNNILRVFTGRFQLMNM